MLRCVTSSANCFNSQLGIGFPAFFTPTYIIDDMVFGANFSILLFLINLVIIYIIAIFIDKKVSR